MTAKALIENGIGETRAAVLDAAGGLVEVHIERHGAGWRAGDVREVRLTSILVPRVRGIVAAGGVEALLTPLPGELTEGAALRVRVVREALAEAGRARLAKVAVTEASVLAGPALHERLASRKLDIVQRSLSGKDLLEDAGWSEAVEAALSGVVPFPGGTLTISPTPAITVIDVDGDLPLAELALAAADAAAAAIVRFDITGSIGIDFPTVGDKAARAAVGARIDALLPQPFDRTAVNGFGLMQIVRPRLRPSLLETVRTDRVATAALRLLRQAERDGVGGGELVVNPKVYQWLDHRPALLAELGRRRGGATRLRADPAVPMSGGYVAPRS